MGTYVCKVRNVNEALNELMHGLSAHHGNPIIKPPGHDDSNWRVISPRGQETLEWRGTYITEYTKPDERVLFSDLRDANPYFHFFESLWILAGRNDVSFLTQFNSKMADFSDDGIKFHAPYGYRLRNNFAKDQIMEVIKMLNKDDYTRQAVMCIWDPNKDLNVVSKDIPCNDLIMLKVRDGALNMTVACRSNDAIWGAYGANAVQFSMIQEFIASSIGARIGTYSQVSDSFHVYTANEAYQRLLTKPYSFDVYRMEAMRPYPIHSGTFSAYHWLEQLENVLEDPTHAKDCPEKYDSFFTHVVLPLWQSWNEYKAKDYDGAIKTLDSNCVAYDWQTACIRWIQRRMMAKGIGI